MPIKKLKFLFKKLYFISAPATVAFRSLCLMLCGCYLAATLFWFTGGTFTIGNIFSAHHKNIAIPYQMLFPLLGTAFILHFFFQYFRLLIKCSRSRFFALLAFVCAITAVTIPLGTWGYWLFAILLLWAFGALFFDLKSWKAVTVHGILFSALAGCGYYIVHLLKTHGKSCYCSGMFLIKSSGQAILPLTLLFLLLLIGTVIAAGWMYSALDKSRFKDIFSMPVKILLILTAISYLAMLAAAIIAGHFADREYRKLNAQFDTPLTAEALQKKYLARKTDAAFWQKLEALYQMETKNIPLYHQAVEPKEKSTAWQTHFSNSQNFAAIDRMLDTPLPHHPRRIEKGNLSGILLPEYQMIRNLSSLQYWRIRFAVKMRDKSAVFAALRRLDNLSRYMDKELLYISAAVKFSVESLKIEALELVLGAKMLNEAELLQLKNSCRLVRNILPELEKNALWCEALMAVDWFHNIVRAEQWDNDRIIPLKSFRFLFVQFYLTYEVNRWHLLNRFQNAGKMHEVKRWESSSVFKYFADYVSPAFGSAGNHFIRADLKQQCLEFFIDQELYFLKHGKYPEHPEPPFNPILNRPMCFTDGELTIKQYNFDGSTQNVTRRGRQLTAIEQPTYYSNNVTVTVLE